MNHMKKIYALPFIAAAGLVSLAVPFAAFAHEHDTFQIGNKMYLVTVGSLAEPAIVDRQSGVDFRVSQIFRQGATSGVPVNGLADSLKVELGAGDKTKIVPLEPSEDAPGAYTAIFIPTVATTYSYRIFGTLNNTPVDLKFTCDSSVSEDAEDATVSKISAGVTRLHKVGAFGCPVASDEYGFPEPERSSYDLNAAASASASSAGTAKTFAIGAFALAVVALVAARRRK